MLNKLSSMSVFSMVGTASIFVCQTLMTHLLPPSEYGEFALWLTDIGYLGMFFVLGLDSSILYHAKLGENYEENMGKNFMIYSIIFLSCLVIVNIANLNVNYYFPLFISIISFSFSSVFKSFFQFSEDYFWFNVLGVIKPLLILSVFSVIYFIGFEIHLYDVLRLYALTSLVVLVIIGIKYFQVSSVKLSKNLFNNFGYFLFGLKSVVNKILSLSLYASTIYCLSFWVAVRMLPIFCC